jgi:hypothetical protein
VCSDEADRPDRGSVCRSRARSMTGDLSVVGWCSAVAIPGIRHTCRAVRVDVCDIGVPPCLEQRLSLIDARGIFRRGQTVLDTLVQFVDQLLVPMTGTGWIVAETRIVMDGSLL